MSDESDKAQPEIERGPAAAGGPGVMTLGDRTLIVRHPTPADFFALQGFARELAAKGTKSPVKAVADQLADIPPEFRAEFIREAVAQTKGEGSPEPTREAVNERASGYEGAAWFTWWLCKDAHPDLTPEAIKSLCPEGKKHELQAALMAAVSLEDRRDPKAPSGSARGSAS